ALVESAAGSACSQQQSRAQDWHLTVRFSVRLAALAWVAATSVHADEPIKPGVDYHSFANVSEFRVKHVSLDLDVSFQKKQLSGHVDLTVLRENPKATVLVLDSRDLDIRSVSLVSQNGGTTPLTFKLGEARQYLGRPLNIDMPAASPDPLALTKKPF